MPSKNEITVQQIIELMKQETGKEIKPMTYYSYEARGQAPARIGKVGNSPVYDRRKVLEWINNRPGRGAGGGRPPRRRTQDTDTTE
ncbi:hypothetical protein ABIC28_005110 [Rhodococcus sp. PvR044]|uniref:transcriptional regulator n=1 Tax=Rhodococcus sp. PvR044 TaxID=3156402 RepID=UPI00339A8229